MEMVDLFCGGGGSSSGFHQAGFETKYAVDNKWHTTQTFNANFGNIAHQRDISTLRSEVILQEFKKRPTLVTSSPPCEPFTPTNHKRIKNTYNRLFDDETGRLTLHALRLISNIDPEFWILENVKGMIEGENKQILREQIIDLLNNHSARDVTKFVSIKELEEARKIAIEMLDLVGIPEPQKRIDSFPHELSGGMRQRAMIAMALSCNPKILIADEPTTALDVTIQAQIIELMQELQKKLGMSIIFITHDLGVVSEISDHVMVMYLGNVMEIAETKELFNNPLHSYTKSLIDIAPQITEEKRKIRLLKGEIPSPINPPSGCVFRTRCPNPSHECKHGTSEMGLIEPKPGHFVDQCCYNCN